MAFLVPTTKNDVLERGACWSISIHLGTVRTDLYMDQQIRLLKCFVVLMGVQASMLTWGWQHSKLEEFLVQSFGVYLAWQGTWSISHRNVLPNPLKTSLSVSPQSTALLEMFDAGSLEGFSI